MKYGTILLLIVIALLAVIAVGAWLWLAPHTTPGTTQSTSTPATSTPSNFSEDGNVIRNNPGLQPDTWYLSYEKPGAPGIAVPLTFAHIPVPPLTQGERVHVEGTIQGGIVSVSSIQSTTAPLETGTAVKLYYYDPAKDQGPSGVQCSRNGLVAVERIIPKTSTPLTDTIKLLLRGELSDQERAAGITTEFPLAGVTLTSATITNGIATLTFADPQHKTDGGSCRVAILWAQIEATAKQFSTVTSVRFMPETLFQP